MLQRRIADLSRTQIHCKGVSRGFRISSLRGCRELIDRLAMLQQTEIEHLGINQVAIEKDWWVTATLKALFQTDYHESLIFKGGTSLSKGFNIIERFSEDIDLAISHSFFGIEKTSKNQREKLRKIARAYIHLSLIHI